MTGRGVTLNALQDNYSSPWANPPLNGGGFVASVSFPPSQDLSNLLLI